MRRNNAPYGDPLLLAQKAIPYNNEIVVEHIISNVCLYILPCDVCAVLRVPYPYLIHFLVFVMDGKNWSF